jgi:hypothetical protein
MVSFVQPLQNNRRNKISRIKQDKKPCGATSFFLFLSDEMMRVRIESSKPKIYAFSQLGSSRR